MRSPLLGLAVAILGLGCESKQPPPADQTAVTRPSVRAPLVDLTATTSLAPVRAAFNAHKGEARFLTLLSPT